MKIPTINTLKKTFILCLQILLLGLISLGCSDTKIEEINIGCIVPLSGTATDLGITPAKAIKLAIDQYNSSKLKEEPFINFYVEDDQWKKEKALPAYTKLRKEHNIDLLYISNTDGTIALKNQVLKDNVILINPLNNDKMLSSLNHNIFEIAKTTEETHEVIAIRIIELGLKNVAILHYPNDFMTRASNSVKKLLTERDIKNKLLPMEKERTDFNEILSELKEEGVDSYVFFGYKNFGYAMKQARALGIKAPFYGSTTLLDPAYYDNSEGAIVDTEFTFFTPTDGNYVLAYQFLKDYEKKYGAQPFSVWPAMQAYDAANIVIDKLKNIHEKKDNIHKTDWLRKQLHTIRYFQGICGNLSITEDGSSRGIYFSLYSYKNKGEVIKVKR